LHSAEAFPVLARNGNAAAVAARPLLMHERT
jgi:hypothetical protein